MGLTAKEIMAEALCLLVSPTGAKLWRWGLQGENDRSRFPWTSIHDPARERLRRRAHRIASCSSKAQQSGRCIQSRQVPEPARIDDAVVGRLFGRAIGQRARRHADLVKSCPQPGSIYYQYHAVPGNIDQLRTFRQRVNRLWRNVRVRRSQRASMKWESLTPVFNRWIPVPRVLHPYPQARFYASHPS
jgi:hypothetical protein